MLSAPTPKLSSGQQESCAEQGSGACTGASGSSSSKLAHRSRFAVVRGLQSVFRRRTTRLQQGGKPYDLFSM
jgi:hypothetical protein